MDAHNVRVAQTAAFLRLLSEVVQCLWGATDFSRKEFQRHRLLKLGVLGEPHHAHSTSPQLTLEHEAPATDWLAGNHDVSNRFHEEGLIRSFLI